MNSYAQAGQDVFAFIMTEGVNNGFYLDVGCHDGKIHSNTLGLEELGWNGMLVDILPACQGRRGRFISCNAAQPNEELAEAYGSLPAIVDYLSLDCDDDTFGAFMALPWGRVKWRVITVETDVYRKGPTDRDRMRTLLSGMGYELICGDVKVEWPPGHPPQPFEDWFIMPGLVKPEVARPLACDGKFWKDMFMFNKMGDLQIENWLKRNRVPGKLPSVPVILISSMCGEQFGTVVNMALGLSLADTLKFLNLASEQVQKYIEAGNS